MKRSTASVLVLLAGAYAVPSQGTVSIANYSTLNNYIYVSFKPATGAIVDLGGFNQGSPAPTLTDYASEVCYGADWTVALNGAPGYNAAASSMMALTTGLGTGPFVTSPLASPAKGDTIAGTWNSSMFGTIPGTTGNGSAASVQLFVWYNDNGVITTVAQAQADGVPNAFSAIVNTTTGGPNPSGPSSTASLLPIFPSQGYSFGFQIATAPEPSTIGLGVGGASMFVMRLRRNK